MKERSCKLKTLLTFSILFVLVFTDIAPSMLTVPPKLPLYIGKGYNVLKGNPLSSEGVDPGFQH
jgi:hypothetical protein